MRQVSLGSANAAEAVKPAVFYLVPRKSVSQLPSLNFPRQIFGGTDKQQGYVCFNHFTADPWPSRGLCRGWLTNARRITIFFLTDVAPLNFEAAILTLADFLPGRGSPFPSIQNPLACTICLMNVQQSLRLTPVRPVAASQNSMFCIRLDSLEYVRSAPCSFHTHRLFGFGAVQCHSWLNGTRSSNPDVPAAVVVELLSKVEVQHISFSTHDLQMAASFILPSSTRRPAGQGPSSQVIPVAGNSSFSFPREICPG